jgi:hypothetical protein
MKSYHFNATVDKDGSVHLSGLPPQQDVEIVVTERTGLPDDLQEWLNDIRQRHPFAKMSKEEVLEALRQTRETVWAERHES